jgi:hypothetical protein
VHKRGFHIVAEVSVVGDSEEASAAPITPRSVGGSCDTPVKENDASNNPAAVNLPFANLSSETGHKYLSEGMITDIISHLSKHR